MQEQVTGVNGDVFVDDFCKVALTARLFDDLAELTDLVCTVSSFKVLRCLLVHKKIWNNCCMIKLCLYSGYSSEWNRDLPTFDQWHRT